MKIDVNSRPLDVYPQDFVNRTAIVVDVLRASTTIVIALHNGCREIVPVDEVDRAFDIATALPVQNVLLCGERNGLKVDGFDLGNSPLEYTPPMVSDRILVFTTSNGTQAIKQAEMAEEVVIAALVNLSSVARYLSEKGDDIIVNCAGRQGQPSLEDAVCAGLLVERISDRLNDSPELTKEAESVVEMAQDYKQDLLSMLQISDAGQYLERIGRKADLEICARLNSVNIVPIFRDGIITSLDRLV